MINLCRPLLNFLWGFIFIFKKFLSVYNAEDEMPIIAVMVALSSLLVIIFIIIILYMLRWVKHVWSSHRRDLRGCRCCCYHGNDWLARRCETKAECSWFFFQSACALIFGRFKKYKQAGSHSNSFRLANGRSDDTGETPWLCCLSLCSLYEQMSTLNAE